ncbi:MAG: hypothetical protein LBN36_00235 [Clostridiales Family XIII bacterium]|jgi:hypothetical protein|nr:hypothetical protein [Clostridiales Family XIII bacterium]
MADDNYYNNFNNDTQGNTGYNPVTPVNDPVTGYGQDNAGYNPGSDPGAGYASYGNPNGGYNGYDGQQAGYESYTTVHATYVADGYYIPPEVRKWNWGAFMFNYIWGIGNHAYLPLLCLIPCFGTIWIFVCGALGNQWAWKSGEFKDLETFLAVQRTWNRAGFVYFIVCCVVIGLYLLIAIFSVAIFGVSFASIMSALNSGYYY